MNTGKNLFTVLSILEYEFRPTLLKISRDLAKRLMRLYMARGLLLL